MTFTSTLLHLTNFRNPFLKTLVPSVSAAFAIQAAVAAPSIIAQSERFYDLSGSLTYLSVTALSLYLPTLRARAAAQTTGKVNLTAWPSLVDAFTGKGGLNGFNWRQVALSAAVGVWALRCMPLPSSLDSAVSSHVYLYMYSTCKLNVRILTSRNSRNTSVPTRYLGWERFPLRRDQKIAAEIPGRLHGAGNLDLSLSHARPSDQLHPAQALRDPACRRRHRCTRLVALRGRTRVRGCG